jgi:hypothetical protein
LTLPTAVGWKLISKQRIFPSAEPIANRDEDNEVVEDDDIDVILGSTLTEMRGDGERMAD